ncbi:kinetochore-associated Ndc80 complex subunit ndc80 [Yamadazyma tenuis]|uniref:Kinetochore protein NDC80 n=1 Tax=Candida tenuis (strain ATCC 10573 / BCRC 21748 / CBS 615 / JCM 9827 / NBRC 10315 / NRRL Y-1498 / VKM Y-70) TaxID=590646 RepID=G3B2X0_CANTC|nr:uncharacterized protein CANTEDRAFT_104161 [Yamadazyma tenuis ATCC 10573]EGV64782.1 hypothetical protein CANTEDRAFT_104161 [Yamadazyma tenuis ATCC 10573]WEJ97576.1 kinetochore-associated Ndc80 complex subunit ndc80 [Yamadazyma tenuis]
MNNVNGILPFPSSLSRKPNKRLSMASATRSSLIHSGTLPSGFRGGLIDSITTSVPSSIKRKSLASTPASLKRRQSSVPSSSQQSQQREEYSQQTVFNSSINTHDSRPLRDKQYQTLIQGEVYEFLRLNKFEVEMNHPLTTKTLKQPTQKDFIMIFQFLYNKIDPFYKFTKSIETEVFTILKLLNYPYLDGINRSQISAVGGSYWPTFLAMLYWLVKLNLQLSEINTLHQNSKSFDDQLNDIYDDYIKKTFISYSRYNNDEFGDIFEEFKTNFEQFNQKLQKEIDSQKSETTTLQSEFGQLNEKMKVYDNSEKKSRALENDLIKFKAYVETVESRQSDWERILQGIEAEIHNCRESSNAMIQEIETYETNLRNKGLDVEKINKLTNERSSLSESIDITNDKIEAITDQLQSKQLQLRSSYESLDNFIKHYNTLIYKMQYKNLTNHNFEVKLNELVWDLSKEFKPTEILDKNLKDEKIELIKFKNEISSRIHAIEDQKIKIQEQVDLLNEKLLEQREDLESLASKFTMDKSGYDQLYNSISDKSTTYSTKIERLTREINAIKVDASSEYLAVMHQYNDVGIEAETLKGSLYRQKNSLHNQIQKIIENTINFKLNIQSNLQDLEELVLRELESDQTE